MANVQLDILLKVIGAMILGGVIGFEREMADKPAGLRTHMLVGGAAALFVSLGKLVVSDLQISPEIMRTDPVRIIEAIITGVTFLGAGTIIRHRMEIEGLTTAASLLFVTSIGVAIALSQLILAIGGTLLAFLILRGGKIIEEALSIRQKKTEPSDHANDN